MRDCLLPEWKSLPVLGEREVQVFALRAGGDAALLARAEKLISPTERERAARIRADLPRAEFVVGRAALRVLLGAATGCVAEAVPLGVEAFGKPFVPGVHSNVSHSKGLIYVALCRCAPVGVDVEWVDPKVEVPEIAEANFRLEEAAALAREPEGPGRAEAFYRVWTRKEAVAKAHGQGLQLPLRNIRVPEAEEGSAWIEPTPSDASCPDTPGRFSVKELAAPQGFVAVLAIRGAVLPARFFAALNVAVIEPRVC